MTAKVLMVAFVARDWGQIGQTFRRKRKFCPPAHRTSEDTRNGGGGFRPEGCRGTGRRKTNPEGVDGKDWKPRGTNPVAFD